MSKTRGLEDLGNLDGDFVIVSPHIIYFRNPWDLQISSLGPLTTIISIFCVQNLRGVSINLYFTEMKDLLLSKTQIVNKKRLC